MTLKLCMHHGVYANWIFYIYVQLQVFWTEFIETLNVGNANPQKIAENTQHDFRASLSAGL